MKSIHKILSTNPLFLWILLSMPIAIIVGSLVAFFLWLLDVVTLFRFEHEWLFYFLPIAGAAIYFLYEQFGKASAAGNKLIIKEAKSPNNGVPLMMAPLILITTIITHLFGGSAGREGTAVQIGGSIAGYATKRFSLGMHTKQICIIMGIAAGFGSVFGTVVAGAVFAIEVLANGKLFSTRLLPSLIAAFIADFVCTQWGISHTHYIVQPIHTFSFITAIKVVIAAIAFGLVAWAFICSNHYVQSKTKEWIGKPWLIPIVGGAMIILLIQLLQTSDYLGLGVNSNNANAVTIVSAFKKGGATHFSWFWKFVFTTITLSMGFKGGEVTPLFFIGATLGNVLALVMNQP
ncbi:MAG: chloride channel protein, partial [Chitinophagaceae bacterium]